MSANHDQGALFLGGDVDGLDLDGLGTLPTTPVAELDLPRELAPGVIARPAPTPEEAQRAAAAEWDKIRKTEPAAVLATDEERREMFRGFGWTS